RAPEVALLPGVAEAGQPDVEPARAEPLQEPGDVRGTPHRHDGDALGDQVPPPAPGQRRECELVADALDEHDGPPLPHTDAHNVVDQAPAQPVPAGRRWLERTYRSTARSYASRRSGSIMSNVARLGLRTQT